LIRNLQQGLKRLLKVRRKFETEKDSKLKEVAVRKQKDEEERKATIDGLKSMNSVPP